MKSYHLIKLYLIAWSLSEDVFRVSPYVTGYKDQNWVVDVEHIKSEHDNTRVLGASEKLLTVGKPLHAVTLGQDGARDHLWTIDYQ